MFLIDDILVSDDVFTQYFCCDLSKCKGCCCVEGDAGAPVKDEEINILENILDEVKPFMTEKGRKVVDEVGAFEVAVDASLTTPLIEGRNCAYAYQDEENITKCAIEKAFLEGKIKFRKPVSCYLYPIRVAELKDNIALNYDQWDICNDAVENGKRLNIKVFQFLKPVLKEVYGDEFYNQMSFVEKNIKIQN
jgi:hypothetical protein